MTSNNSSSDDPDLWREIYGYMQVCLYEDDEADLSFRVTTEDDLFEVEALGIPEETIRITITCQDQTPTIQRIVHPVKQPPQLRNTAQHRQSRYFC